MEYETFILAAADLSTVIEKFFRERDIQLAGGMTVLTGAVVAVVAGS